jgi:hypothetical protein
MENSVPQTNTDTDAEFDRNFKPKGAIAFFILLVILGMIIWYGIYFLMLQRA